MGSKENIILPVKARERLISAARNLFHEQGYERTSIEDILEVSRVVRSNFYYHFKGKEHLALAVVESQMQRFRDQVLARTLRNPRIPPQERFRQFLELITTSQEHWGAQRGSFFGGFAFEFGASHGKVRDAIATFYRVLEYALADCLAEGALTGAFRIDREPQVMARIIIASLEGAMLIAKAQGNIEVLQSVAENITDLVRA